MFWEDKKKKKIKNVGLVSKKPLAKLTFPIVEFMTDDELIALPRNYSFIFDTECFSNFWFIAFKCVENGKLVTFEKSPVVELDTLKLSWLVHSFKLIGFNSIKYDNVMLAFALANFTLAGLKGISDEITITGTRPIEIMKQFDIEPLKINNIDLIEVCPLSNSLKGYAARLHAKRMQDLPIDPHSTLSEQQAVQIRWYCINDLDNTLLIFNELQEQLALREQMSQKYRQDLRSKSDAQIAETVIMSEITKIRHFKPRKPQVDFDANYIYMAPCYISFTNPCLVSAFKIIRSLTFKVDHNGSPILPEEIKNLNIVIGNSRYTMGFGGLHSNEQSVTYKQGDYLIVDRDVESFYPRLILSQKLFPSHLGEVFLEVYNDIVETRIKAKRNKDNITSDALKIVINGTYGKLGSQWSNLYSPRLMIQVTMTGQLVLLMLIERIEALGISVVSGNTDGIVSLVPKDRYDDFLTVVKQWEIDTNFITEETQYSIVANRDVNNYIAVKTDNKTKGKGFLANPWNDKKTAIKRFEKNPEHTICTEAVEAFLTKQIPISETILNCTDITKFVVVRAAKGGAEKDGQYLGKVIRWYYAKDEYGYICYKGSGNKVANSDGASPLMELPDTLPTDINFERYVSIANEILEDIGYYKKASLF